MKRIIMYAERNNNIIMFEIFAIISNRLAVIVSKIARQ